ncbi:DUF883 family protein [Aquamicrobium terrae]|uniref:ElaB/YqjD/DUF883 family membrane-anchored ribosome-binding protein n=1 Tax=Aquamicrobium terrae TaxID=1324945 RepID=A0ABV2MTN6_9HYPH
MASFSSLSDMDLEKQVAQLSKELTSLKKQLSKRGNRYYDEGREALSDYRDTISDYYDEISGRIGEHLPDLRKRARAIEHSAREHPATTAAVGLIVLGLVASLLLSRR